MDELYRKFGTKKALTIKQPYAAQIVAGIKRVERRTWATTYRGPLLIHAGKRRDALEQWREQGEPCPPDDQLAFGAVIGCVDVVGVERVGSEWHWRLRNPRPCEPVPCRGMAGLFEI